MANKYYAAYGSNLNLVQMTLRCPKAKVVGISRLEGYTLAFRGAPGAAVATIEPHQNRSVPIMVWEITPDCEKRLDEFEGFPSLYEKRILHINLNKRDCEIMVYTIAPGLPENQPSSGYFNTILEGYNSAGFNTERLYRALREASGSKMKGDFYVKKALGSLHNSNDGIRRCACCGIATNDSEEYKTWQEFTDPNGERGLVCRKCIRLKPEHYDSEEYFYVANNKSTERNNTYGFELECIPNSDADMALLISSHYGWYNCHDRTIAPYAGVEFKSKIFTDMRVLKHHFDAFERCCNHSNPHMGSHIHIGNPYLDMDEIADYLMVSTEYRTALELLSDYLMMSADTEMVFGRTFNKFTFAVGGNKKVEAKYCFINICHNSTIEFRLPKFVTSDQYYISAHLCDEWFNLITGFAMDNDCMTENEEPGQGQLLAQKMIDVFEKYVEKNSKIQRQLKGGSMRSWVLFYHRCKWKLFKFANSLFLRKKSPSGHSAREIEAERKKINRHFHPTEHEKDSEK